MDRASVGAGAAIAVLGVLLGLDRLGAVELGFGWTPPLVLAAVGVLLLAVGLDGPRRR